MPEPPVVSTARLCQQLDAKVSQYEVLVRRRAQAEATYKAEKAKRTLAARPTTKSNADAELIATSDDEVRDLHLAYLTADGEADACRMAILALRTRIEYGRSLIATEREADRQHAIAGGR